MYLCFNQHFRYSDYLNFKSCIASKKRQDVPTVAGLWEGFLNLELGSRARSGWFPWGDEIQTQLKVAHYIGIGISGPLAKQRGASSPIMLFDVFHVNPASGVAVSPALGIPCLKTMNILLSHSTLVTCVRYLRPSASDALLLWHDIAVHPHNTTTLSIHSGFFALPLLPWYMGNSEPSLISQWPRWYALHEYGFDGSPVRSRHRYIKWWTSWHLSHEWHTSLKWVPTPSKSSRL
jgi:hypothetical protein